MTMVSSRSDIAHFTPEQTGIALTWKTERMHVYDTVTEALKGLKSRGFDLDFNLEENCIVCHGEKFDANAFEIVEVYRFEGNTNPSDEAVVYAIQSHNGLKGVLVNGYGIYSEQMSDDLVKKLRFHK